MSGSSVDVSRLSGEELLTSDDEPAELPRSEQTQSKTNARRVYARAQLEKIEQHCLAPLPCPNYQSI